jgi:hypothetical protein
MTYTKTLLATAALAAMMGCGGGSKEPASEGGAEKAAAPSGDVWKPTGNEGTVTGKVAFNGTPPKMKPLSMDADAVCAARHKEPVMPEVVVANKNGTLRNVFVYVKSGLEGKNFGTPGEAIELDQEGCLYKPHVLGIQAGQNLRIVTSDDTTHNIHPMPKVNREFNVSQPPKADAIVRTFSRPEVSIPVKCNQHPWMRAYIHVVSHPFHAVTGEDGTFKIENLPPGNYEIEAVHEQYGASTQKVTVGDKETKSVDFSYAAGQAFRPSSLQAAPALIVHCCGEK